MLSDLRFALRQLAKAPTFTVIAWLTLAIGVGLATVVFSAINALLFKPLPLIAIAEDRLAYITETESARGQDDLGWNYLDYLNVRERASTLVGVWVHSDLTTILAGSEVPERLRGTMITWDAFDLMGIKPIRGRNFSAADATSDGKNVALISSRLWKRRFGSAEDAIGRTTTVNGQPTTIVGVMPDGWRYPEVSDVWMPLRPDEKLLKTHGYYAFSGRALLRPGLSREKAQAELDTIMAGLAREFPNTNTGIGAQLRDIRGNAVANTNHFATLLLGPVMLVFLIACVNVANLLLARATTRGKEVAIRLALGADRARVIRGLVTESVVLGLLGGIGGFIVALWGNDAVVATIPFELPFWLRFDFDVRVFGFIAGLSIVSALIFGLVPALKASRPDIVSELKEGGRSVETSGPRALRLRNILVVLEIALALVMLVGAGLMLRSFFELRRINPGFDFRGVLTFRTGWPADMVRDNRDAPGRFFDAVLVRLAVLPGVESAALTTWLPGREGRGYTGSFQIEGRPLSSPDAAAVPAQLRIISGNYFRTVRIPMLAGRAFDDAVDQMEAPRAVIVDEAFAIRHFGSVAGAVGQRITEAPERSNTEVNKPPGFATIIGVAGNIRHHLDRADEQSTLYFSRKQGPESFNSVVLRVRGNPDDLTSAARDAVMAVNREIPIYDISPLEEVVLMSHTVWPLRFFSYLFTAFGLVALFLACIGIYGVVSYNVAQRGQELGVRMALGAQSGEIIHLVVRHGAGLVACGLGAGLIAAFFLTHLLGTVLYGISPRDPSTFAVVPTLLAVVALFACWLPGWRATRIEPNAALRAE